MINPRIENLVFVATAFSFFAAAMFTFSWLAGIQASAGGIVVVASMSSVVMPLLSRFASRVCAQ